MSIQRYAPFAGGSMVEDEEGAFVKFDDAWKEIFGLCSVLADIRAALGVGDKPMLSDLPKIVREIREQADRDEKAACKAMEERDKAVEALWVARHCMQNEFYNKPRRDMEKECSIVDAVLAKIGGQG